ncbi:hypothetical protein [Pseudoxanthomonas winnipegensis]|uniref:Uncharacterized protein n=1 Tax=Pseudoxanthomonas winnipegensis TaxID=2480810 RepID=A0A4Q8LMF2_9GAMM|nr:hypothetical protein [Pseudoxanthomonas winnipegensis]RZZ83506.1 hypothetical protein EA663_16720 [Pseudoxanthomonas winnipegensis]TAA31758.1 hypothetical protein EA656_18195 [Pseudoxanthomonas winnipegensis]
MIKKKRRVALALMGLTVIVIYQYITREVDEKMVAENNSRQLPESIPERDSTKAGLSTGSFHDQDIYKADASHAAKTVNLKFETQLLRNGSISYSQAYALLVSKDFATHMQEIRRQSNGDLDASEMTEVYEKLINDACESQSSIELETLACGLNMCAGSIRTYGSNGELLYPLVEATLTPPEGGRMYSMVETSVTEQEDVSEHRFVFSTNPNSNSISGDNQRPAPDSKSLP